MRNGQQTRGQVVYTNKARCRDCYRCVRVCPVKAIRMHGGQASVEEARCIACGTCIRECPQGAKSYRNDLERAARLLRAGGPVAVSLAPAFAARWSTWERRRLPSALRQLGFTFVAQTATAARAVAGATAALRAESRDRPVVTDSCPAVVSFVEKYRPTLVPALAGLPSPMLAHAAHLKRRLGQDARVVFVGPCVAKKAEAQRPEARALVDCVLTFEELDQWLQESGIALDSLEESAFDEQPDGRSRAFALPGGALETGRLPSGPLERDVVAVSGFSEVSAALDLIEAADREEDGLLVEPLFCPGGCIDGPAFGADQGLMIRRRAVLDYAGEGPPEDQEVLGPGALPPVRQAGHPADDEPLDEEAIREELERVGRGRRADRLDCGACGYGSCREKAVAVLRGMADEDICIPTMRRLAERRADRIVESSPNGILILDEHLQILSMNPAFRRFFMCSESVCGRPVSYLMDPEPFERLAAGPGDLVELTVHHERYKLVCHQILYPLREEHQYVGIFVNVTRSQADRKQLERLRAETVLQARELLEHQIGMARKLASYLGESTARGEALVENLLALVDPPDEGRREPADGWKWKISTSR